jgi:hypothetical protein
MQQGEQGLVHLNVPKDDFSKQVFMVKRLICWGLNKNVPMQ